MSYYSTGKNKHPKVHFEQYLHVINEPENGFYRDLPEDEHVDLIIDRYLR